MAGLGSFLQLPLQLFLAIAERNHWIADLATGHAVLDALNQPGDLALDMDELLPVANQTDTLTESDLLPTIVNVA